MPSGEEVSGYIRSDGQIDLQKKIYFKVSPDQTEKQQQFYGEASGGINFIHAGSDPAIFATEGDKKQLIGQVGIALQMETILPKFSRKLITQYSLGFYRWIGLKSLGGILDDNIPTASMTGNFSAHFLFNPMAKTKWYSRLGAAINFDFGAQAPLRPGFSIGLGAYLPSGLRLGLQYESLLIIKGIVIWQAVVAVPFLQRD